ncbi:unnamed protein product [Meloidogyne enterolobii]|uniref:Uncharacterized protein n=1 Tax=Meloidogyne enterolobii TaxID=390850 RepID=A0ACB0ZHU0_MELEN
MAHFVAVATRFKCIGVGVSILILIKIPIVLGSKSEILWSISTKISLGVVLIPVGVPRRRVIARG